MGRRWHGRLRALGAAVHCRRGMARLGVACILAGCALPAAAQALWVGAAASLAQAFQEIGKDFEARHPGARLVLHTASSGQLLQQLAQGAPMDVLASADAATMDRAVQQQLVRPATRVDFAGNRLVLVQPADAPVRLSRLQDLAGPGVRRIAFGTPATVPAGRYARMALEAAGLWEPLQPKWVPGESVRQVLAYVARGEADAGFVYASDVALERGRVRVVAEVPTAVPVVYPIARATGSRQPALAEAFLAHVRSPAGQAVLARHGFTAVAP